MADRKPSRLTIKSTEKRQPQQPQKNIYTYIYLPQIFVDAEGRQDRVSQRLRCVLSQQRSQLFWSPGRGRRRPSGPGVTVTIHVVAQRRTFHGNRNPFGERAVVLVPGFNERDEHKKKCSTCGRKYKYRTNVTPIDLNRRHAWSEDDFPYAGGTPLIN